MFPILYSIRKNYFSRRVRYGSEIFRFPGRKFIFDYLMLKGKIKRISSKTCDFSKSFIVWEKIRKKEVT